MAGGKRFWPGLIAVIAVACRSPRPGPTAASEPAAARANDAGVDVRADSELALVAAPFHADRLDFRDLITANDALFVAGMYDNPATFGQLVPSATGTTDSFVARMGFAGDLDWAQSFVASRSVIALQLAIVDATLVVGLAAGGAEKCSGLATWRGTFSSIRAA